MYKKNFVIYMEKHFKTDSFITKNKQFIKKNKLNYENRSLNLNYQIIRKKEE